MGRLLGSASTAVAFVFAACVGAIGDGGPNGDGGEIFDGTDPGDPRVQARVWRLTPAQYNREVARLFPGAPEVNLPLGASEHGLTNIAETARIDLGNASQFVDAARSIGTWASQAGASAARCEDFGTPACIDTFLAWFPEQAYRRPLSDSELTELRAVYDDLLPTYGEEWAFAALIRTVLLSPHFLYRTEIGALDAPATGVVELTDHEIASLMAFSLTDEGPDDELLAAAAAGTLRDPATREQHARRLMADSAGIWQRFFWEWLQMGTLESQGNETELDPALVADLRSEYDALVADIVVDSGGTLSDLLTSDHTWGTPAVADYYGVTHPTGEGMAELTLDPSQRGGLLTLGAWLVSHGKKGRDNVVRRGMGIFRDAMCREIEPLDIDLEEALKELVGADATIKEIVEARSQDEVCGACHRTSDPMGLVFENFAGDGSWQTVYSDGKPVEPEVTIDDQDFDNAVQLSAALAEDEKFQQCLVQRFGHFVMGADFGSPVSVRPAKDAFEAFVASGGSFEELLVAIVRDPAFIERRKP